MKKITAGVYETSFPVTIEYPDGKTETLPATAVVESMAGMWDDGGWNIRLEAKRPSGIDIELTNCNEHYYTKRSAVDSLQHLTRWRKSEHGWVIH